MSMTWEVGQTSDLGSICRDLCIVHDTWGVGRGRITCTACMVTAMHYVALRGNRGIYPLACSNVQWLALAYQTAHSPIENLRFYIYIGIPIPPIYTYYMCIPIYTYTKAYRKIIKYLKSRICDYQHIGRVPAAAAAAREYN